MGRATERHRKLAAVLPVSDGGPVVDLGCGGGGTMRALRERLGPRIELVGVERDVSELVASDPNLRFVAADLKGRLPFEDESFEAAVCHNVLECLPDKRSFLEEVARVLRPDGHLLLGHTDFDTMVFNAPDIELTRRLVHANADTQEAWMDASDGAIGRKLLTIAQGSRFEIARMTAWVLLDTSFAAGGLAHTATRSISASVRRDQANELVMRLEAWLEDLRALAQRGEFLFSVNDYAVLLRKTPG